VQVSGLTSGVSALTSGHYFTCAVVSGAAKCWGANNDGQLGNGKRLENRPLPGDVIGLTSGVTDISAGDFHVCAIVDGGVRCWGLNQYGNLGDGSAKFEQDTPVAVPGLTSGVVQVSSAGDHTCALTATGAVFCCGENSYGEAGDGSLGNKHTPVAVTGLQSGVIEIGVGVYHVCARLQSGIVKCWGYNSYGQLGNGTTVNSAVPVAVLNLKPQCLVPNMMGMTLAQAKQALAKANCRLGNVGQAFSSKVKRGRLLSQKPRAGARLVANAKVSVVLSAGKEPGQ
jgi:alpha-tubulin suppressor-like RCC1 family protein